VAVVSAICGQPDAEAAAFALSAKIAQVTVHRNSMEK
jgi:thiamine monophosphate synthase